MNELFESSEINKMKLGNRFIRSATMEGMASDDGSCTLKLINLMTELARGGVGLIISGQTYIRPDGKARPWQLGVHIDELIPKLHELTDAVHENKCKIALQLSHAGIFSNFELTGQTPIAPSCVEGIAKRPCKVMTAEDIQAVVEAFAAAAQRAKAAGFDGVQIHGAHGYLLSQFISPKFNLRGDQYGGSIENRARMPIEVLRAIRGAVGSDFPILIKMNSKEFTDEGLMPEEFVQVGRILTDEGIDAIEVSGGLPINPKTMPSQLGINNEVKEAYFQEEAKMLKIQTNVPIILVGGIRSFHVAERLVAEGVADYISMSRPLIREPHLINRWKAGDLTKSTCVSDNMCFQPASEGKGVYCVTEKREKTKKDQ